MRVINLFFALLLCLTANAQFNFNSGSAELDKELNDINNSAKSDLSKYKSDLGNLFHVGVSEVEKVLSAVTEPAEAHLAFKISQITSKPVDQVLKSYSVNKDKGWGAIAKDLGIKPGSPEFHALKGKSKSTGNSNSHGNSNGNGQGKKK